MIIISLNGITLLVKISLAMLVGMGLPMGLTYILFRMIVLFFGDFAAEVAAILFFAVIVVVCAVKLVIELYDEAKLNCCRKDEQDKECENGSRM